MNRLNLNSVKIEKDYMKIENKDYTVVFTNAENDRSFNRNTEDGKRQLDLLKDEFNVYDVVYLNQIHSDIIYKYEKNSKEDIKTYEGDAIVTNERNVIIGAFTADCVPVILVDKNKRISCAIHSGWKGTYESITLKAIEKMKREFGCDENDIEGYIGPHIRKCCYEVSEDLKEKFIEKKKSINEDELFTGRNLSLESCIIDDMRNGGLKEENINTLDLCTHCTEEVKLHSYRKSNGTYGRMFTFVIMN